MSDDLISRQVAIEYFVINVGWHDEDGYPVEDSDELRKIWTDLFNGLPSAQQWIPVTERLPESGRSVLIAENDTDPDWYAAIGQYKYGKWEWRDDMHTALPPKVIAWMPLPKPWRGEGNGDDNT